MGSLRLESKAGNFIYVIRKFYPDSLFYMKKYLLLSTAFIFCSCSEAVNTTFNEDILAVDLKEINEDYEKDYGTSDYAGLVTVDGLNKFLAVKGGQPSVANNKIPDNAEKERMKTEMERASVQAQYKREMTVWRKYHLYTKQ